MMKTCCLTNVFSADGTSFSEASATVCQVNVIRNFTIMVPAKQYIVRLAGYSFVTS